MRKLLQTVTVAVAIAFGCCGVVLADTVSLVHGGDTFVAGAQVNQLVETDGDAFLAGRTVAARGSAGGDLHASGFDISIHTAVDGDLYAAGMTVNMLGTVAEDRTAVGFSVRTEKGADTAGNARLFGNSVTIEGPVAGALMVTGRDVILNASIRGDARILAQSLTFGPDAQITGTLTYSAQTKIAVPERVAPAERVVFEPLKGSQVWDAWDKIGEEMPLLPTFASLFFGFVITLLFYIVLGAVVLGFMPKQLASLRRSIAHAPGQTVLSGVVGLSILLGMVPIIALTIVGIPFVPVVLLLIVVFWTLGYALGAYGVAMRVWSGFGGADDPGHGARLMVFAAALICVALLNFIPFVGWVANYTLVLLGAGAMTRALFHWLVGNPNVALDVDMKPIEN